MLKRGSRAPGGNRTSINKRSGEIEDDTVPTYQRRYAQPDDRKPRLAEIKGHGFALTLGRLVGFAEDNGEAFEMKTEGLITTLAIQFTEGARLEAEIRKHLRALGLEF
jgi:hypothetical protein